MVQALILLSLVIAIAGCQQATPEPPEPPAVTQPAAPEATELPASPASTQPAAPEATEPPPSEPDATEPPANMEEPVTLQMWYLSGNPVEVDAITKIVEKYEETHPGVKVEISVYGFEDMNKVLKLALDSGSGPDIAFTGIGLNDGTAYAKAGHLLDLNDAIKKYAWDKRFNITDNQGWWWDYWTPGHHYGIPFDMATVGVYYNKAVFDELGLQVPKTFDEFQQLLATIKAKKPDIAVISTGAGEGWPLSHVYDQIVHSTVPYEELKKAQLLSPEGNWLQPGYIEAAEILKDWGDKGYFQDNLMATNDADALSVFLQGKSALWIGGSWHNGELIDAPFEVHFFGMPSVHPDINPDGSWHYGGYTPNNHWMINNASQHQEQALDVLDYMLNKDAAVTLWNDIGDLVAYTFTEGEAPAPIFPFQKEIYDLMHTAQTGFYNDITAYWNDHWAIYQSLMAGKLTPESAMQQIQDLYLRAVTESQ
jgi:raffinose/stachyose/melibiose transport system substrate-binding protein